MRPKYAIILLFVGISLIYNFKMPNEVIDQILMVKVAGYDYVDEETIRGTVIAPTYMKEGKLVNLVYSNTSTMIYENRSKLNRQASEPFLNGKLEVALFNKELAKQGLSKYIDYLLRDPGIGSQLYLAVVEGSTYEMLSALKTKKGVGLYLSDLIKHNIQTGNMPIINVKQFSSKIAGKRSDPYLPTMKLVNGSPKITGMAIFDGDKYVDKLSPDEVVLFKMLHEDMEDGQYFLDTKKYNASIQNIASTRTVNVTKKNGTLKVNFALKIDAVVREFTGKGGLKKMTEIKKVFEEVITSKSMDLIKQMQEKNVDPLGIEEIVQSRFRDYDPKKFKENYPTLEIDVDIDFTISEFGIRR